MSEPKVFFLTGCASGIGRHLSDVLVKQGQYVIATDVDQQGLRQHATEQAWPERQVLVSILDVRDPASWEDVMTRAIARFGRLDVHMNIAGLLGVGKAELDTVDQIHCHVDVNLKGVIFGTQMAARQMIHQGTGGHIINIASQAGLCAIPYLALYSATKHAVRAYSLAVAEEFRGYGISVTAVCPYTVATPMVDRQKNNDDADIMFSQRMLTVEDLEKAILGPVLSRRPLEYALPRFIGWQAKLVNLTPGVARWFTPLFRRLGAKRRERIVSGATAPAERVQ